MDTTVIEEILENIGTVPNAVKRNLELMRELDARVASTLSAAQKEERAVLTKAQKECSSSSTSVASALGSEGRSLVASIAKKRRHCDDLSDEKVGVAEQTVKLLGRHLDAVGRELSALSAHLRATGEFEASGAKPGDEVAIRMEDSSWILARVVKFRAESSAYDVADADDERKVYQLPEARVVPLTEGHRAAPHALAPVASVLSTVVSSGGGHDNKGAGSISGGGGSGGGAGEGTSRDGQAHVVKLAKGDEVFAIYPDTTSFYPAVVSVPPRRAIAANTICHVQFNDDADESGLNPDRPVALKYILRPVV